MNPAPSGIPGQNNMKPREALARACNGSREILPQLDTAI
jgi:hypothetical protein